MGAVKTRVRVVSLRSFDPVIAELSPKAYRAWGRSLEWSCFHGRDGMLTPEDLRIIAAGPAATKELLERGVWKLDEHGRTFVAELREGPVVAEVEGSEVEHDRPMTAAERAKAYRARKRDGASRNGVTECDAKRDERHVTNERDVTQERDVTVVTGGPTGGSDSGSSPDPESSSVLASDLEDGSGSARDSGKRAKRRCGIPKDWKWTEKHVEMASKSGLDLPGEARRFRAHHEAKGSLMANWNAAFTTWLLRSPLFNRTVAANGQVLDEHRRPYHEPFKQEEAEPGLAPADALAAIQKAKAAVLGRTMP